MKGLIKKLLREGLEESTFKSELKGRNLLFHNVNNYNVLFDILKRNSIEDRTKQEIITSGGKGEVTGVSLTRDSEFYWGDFQFILDGDLIKRDFGKKLRPFDFIKGVKPKSHPSRNHWSSGKIPKKYKKNDKGFYDEVGDYEEVVGNHLIAPSNPQSEEFLIGPIKNLNKYLLGVRFKGDFLSKVDSATIGKLINLLNETPIYDKQFNKLNLTQLLNKEDRLGDGFINKINNDDRIGEDEIIHVLKNSPNIIDKIIKNGMNKLHVNGFVFERLIKFSKEVSKIIKALNEEQLDTLVFTIVSNERYFNELYDYHKKHNNLNFGEIIEPYVVNFFNKNEIFRERYGSILKRIKRLK